MTTAAHIDYAITIAQANGNKEGARSILVPATAEYRNVTQMSAFMAATTSGTAAAHIAKGEYGHDEARVIIDGAKYRTTNIYTRRHMS